MNKSFTICPATKAPIIILLNNHCYQKHDCSDHCKYYNSYCSLLFSDILDLFKISCYFIFIFYVFDFYRISWSFHKITPVIFRSATAIPPRAVPNKNAGKTITPRNFNVSKIPSIMKSTVKIVFTTHDLKWYLFVYFFIFNITPRFLPVLHFRIHHNQMSYY